MLFQAKALLKKLYRKLLSVWWRLFGVNQIIEQNQKMQNKLQKQFLLMCNNYNYLHTDLDEIKETSEFKRCSDIVSLLEPMDVKEKKFIRVGQPNDGGYVILNDFYNIDAVYSFGIGNDVSFDSEMASYGFDVFMYDHTIKKLPKSNPKFVFYKKGLTGYMKGNNLCTLKECIMQNGHEKSENLILKMDIEGSEWDVFNETNSQVINQFIQIVVEFHGFLAAVYDSKSRFEQVISVLEKLNQTHQCVHLHANTCSLPVCIGNFVVPDLLEVTYLRKAGNRYKFISNKRQFPTDLDQPTFSGGPDLYLGSFA